MLKLLATKVGGLPCRMWDGGEAKRFKGHLIKIEHAQKGL
jgi:hypothetical protein